MHTLVCLSLSASVYLSVCLSLSLSLSLSLCLSVSLSLSLTLSLSLSLSLSLFSIFQTKQYFVALRMCVSLQKCLATLLGRRISLTIISKDYADLKVGHDT